MTVAISRETRHNDNHPAQMRGPQMKKRPTHMGKSLSMNATNRLSTKGSSKVAETPGKANR